ncbi:hypothetical protein CJ673_11230 [Aliarcobacter cryaerophilus]|uniref:Uncharacterized protein n=1 Tax=Aliarcobacter cryaerophilus TaxID=28198 RepID=A0A2S9SZH7_9BACT|nr:hypothetical protein [Aliarcobacter cryaerophilus]PRM91919.1 hypothetical protein CJ673_11230 [Aliarcobacter cryaerophilus]
MEYSITVALMAGFISYIGLVITKEQKISDFRQEWINSIRNDVADLMKELHHFYMAYLVAQKESQSNIEFLKNNLLITNQIQFLVHKIKLRLNPDDSDGIIKLLDEIMNIITSPTELKDDENFDKLTEKLNTKAHELFKSEWERVKRGEKWFRWSKWFLFLGSVYLIGYSIVGLS